MRLNILIQLYTRSPLLILAMNHVRGILRYLILLMIILFCLFVLTVTLNFSNFMKRALNIDQIETIQRHLERFDAIQPLYKNTLPKVLISARPHMSHDMRGWRSFRHKITQFEWRNISTRHPVAMNSTESDKGVLQVYLWWESCYTNVNAFKAALGFPFAPEEILNTKSLLISRGRSLYGERIFGYLVPYSRGFYRFSLTTLDPVEVWLSKDSDPHNSKLIISTANEQPSSLTALESSSLYLPSKLCYLEIIHLSTNSDDMFLLQWLLPGKSNYSFISHRHFQSIAIPSHPSVPSPYSMHKVLLHGTTKFTTLSTINYTVPRIQREIFRDSFPDCFRLDVITTPHNLLQYHGLYELVNTRVYPDDGSQMYNVMEHEDKVVSISGNEYLPKETIDSVLQLFLTQAMEALFAANLTFSRINRVEEKSTKGFVTRYLIDLIFENTFEHKTYRFVDYLFIEGRYSLNLCTIPNYVISPVSPFVYFIIIVKNLGQALYAFVQELEKLWYETRDENFGLIVVDFMSTDMNVSVMLRSCALRNYRYISMSGPFIKVQGQNAALQSIKDDDVILFLCDLHLNFPVNILDGIRTHTVKGVLAYAPIVFRLQCGHSLVNPLGFWEVWGTGLFALFRSDWKVLGGMDTDKYWSSWGGEDSDLLDRALSLGYEVERKALPGLVHFFHTQFGLWDD